MTEPAPHQPEWTQSRRDQLIAEGQIRPARRSRSRLPSESFVTYDSELADAAKDRGLPVVAPSY